MKVHVIDGTFELFRAYYGAPSYKTPEGMEVAATRSFLKNLKNFIRSDDVTHVAVAFDTIIESFRNELYDGYKTSEGLDPEIFAQFPLVEEGTRALGVVVWSMIDFEADDALCSAAKKYSKNKDVSQVIICSPDKDLMQCVEGEKIISQKASDFS